MPTSVNFNGSNWPIPNTGERIWGDAVTNFLIAVAQNALSKAGGSFALTADANFGTNYGLVAKYLKSTSTNIATTGVIRFANNEGLAWRNAANSADKTLKIDSNDKLAFGSSAVSEAEFGYLSGVTSAIQTQLDAAATDTDLTNHENDTSTHGVGTVAGLSETQVFTNKDYDGGTAANSRRITLPKDTYANLLLLTRKEGTIWYATDLDTVFYDDGSSLLPVGSASGSGELNAVSNPSMATATTGWTGATRDTTNSPLNPVVPTCIAIANTATTEGPTTGGYFPITSLATGLRSRKLKVEFYYSTPATDNYAVSVYRGSTRISLTTDTSGATNLPKSTIGKFYAEFDADNSSSSYTVSVTRTSGSTGTCYITNVIIGPGLQVQGPRVGIYERVSSLSVGGSTSAPTPGSGTTYYRETVSNGDGTATIRYEIRQTVAGSAGSGDYLLPLPAGLSIDYERVGKLAVTGALGDCGKGTLLVNATYFDATATVLNTGAYVNKIVVNYSGDVTPTTTWGSGGGSFANTTINVALTVRVPITEWANQGTVNLLNQQTQSPIKAGIIMPFAGATVPTGWLECDGSTYSQTLYPQLYATLGSTWATCTNPLTGSAYSAPTAGNFRVPDLRGTFLRGTGTFSDGIGTDTTLAGYQADQMQGHYHSTPIQFSSVNDAGTNFPYLNQGTAEISGTVTGPITDGTNGTPRTGKETRPRNVGVKYIIKAWDESFNLAGFGIAQAGQSGLIGYYQEDDTSMVCTFAGNAGGAASASVNIKVTRIGRQVTIDIPAFTAVVPTTNSIALISSVTLPSWARPAATKSAVCHVHNNSAWVTTGTGFLFINNSTFKLEFYRDILNTAWTNSSNCGWYHTQITYTV